MPITYVLTLDVIVRLQKYKSFREEKTKTSLILFF